MRGTIDNHAGAFKVRSRNSNAEADLIRITAGETRRETYSQQIICCSMSDAVAKVVMSEQIYTHRQKDRTFTRRQTWNTVVLSSWKAVWRTAIHEQFRLAAHHLIEVI